jgi:hypothetical protein
VAHRTTADVEEMLRDKETSQEGRAQKIFIYPCGAVFTSALDRVLYPPPFFRRTNIPNTRHPAPIGPKLIEALRLIGNTSTKVEISMRSFLRFFGLADTSWIGSAPGRSRLRVA